MDLLSEGEEKRLVVESLGNGAYLLKPASAIHSDYWNETRTEWFRELLERLPDLLRDGIRVANIIDNLSESIDEDIREAKKRFNRLELAEYIQKNGL